MSNAVGRKHVKAEGTTCLDFNANCKGLFLMAVERKGDKKEIEIVSLAKRFVNENVRGLIQRRKSCYSTLWVMEFNALFFLRPYCKTTTKTKPIFSWGMCSSTKVETVCTKFNENIFIRTEVRLLFSFSIWTNKVHKKVWTRMTIYIRLEITMLISLKIKFEKSIYWLQ